jgi:hypothetical protein
VGTERVRISRSGDDSTGGLPFWMELRQRHLVPFAGTANTSRLRKSWMVRRRGLLRMSSRTVWAAVGTFTDSGCVATLNPFRCRCGRRAPTPGGLMDSVDYGWDYFDGRAKS